jgi:hypothetical protein
LYLQGLTIGKSIGIVEIERNKAGAEKKGEEDL